MSRLDDLAPMLAAGSEAEIGFHQGVVTAWDTDTGANTVDVAGATFTDVPLLNTSGAVNLTAGDVVVMLRVRSAYFIVGRVTPPGSSEFDLGSLRVRGDLIVPDGGNIEARGGGKIKYVDGDGNLRVDIASYYSNVGAAIVLYDQAGGERVSISSVHDANTGEVVDYGIGVFDKAGQYRILLQGERGEGAEIYDAAGRKTIKLPGVTRGGASHNSSVEGGPGTGGVPWAMLEMASGDSGTGTELRSKLWNGDYVPHKASDFLTASSSRHTKDVLEDEITPALASVRQTRIRRWRHKGDVREPGTGNSRGPKPIHIGPMAEEAPADVADWGDPDGALNLGNAVWTLWRAVQEQADQLDQLRAELDTMKGRPHAG